MEIKITYQELKDNHPDLVDTLVTKIRSTNSKEKDKPEKDYEWFYSYGVVVRGMSFGDMLNQLPEKKEENGIDESMAKKLKAVMGLSVVVAAGRTKRYVALNYDDIDKMPKLFIEKLSEMHKKNIEEDKKEQERFNKLTPEEQNRETQETINELNGMGGFIGLNVNAGEISRIESKEIDYDVDAILDKISRVGFDGLTAGEKKFLEENSKK